MQSALRDRNIQSDENINKLIDIKNNSGDPGDFLEALLDDMLMDLEK